MNTKKILIVEDEILIAEYIKTCLINLGLQQIYMTHNRKNAVEAVDYIKPDLTLLDIHLKNPYDGIEIAREMDEKFKLPYIFITANSDMLVMQKAISAKTAAYITKPIKKTDLLAAIQIALQTTIEQEQKYLVIKDNHTIVKVFFNDILYIESSGNYINLITLKGKIVLRQSLESIKVQLPEIDFIHIHRSFIINKKHIEKISPKTVSITGIPIPVSRGHHTKISEYLSGE